MSEKKQIVDNPLLLTSLFSEGIFYIPTEKKDIAEEVTTEVPTVSESPIVIETVPESLIAKLQDHLTSAAT